MLHSTLKEMFKNNERITYINFLIWMTNTEKIVYAKIESRLDDLPDEDYYSYYEDGVTYDNMAKIVIKNNSY